jgi:hypothetical protein
MIEHATVEAMLGAVGFGVFAARMRASILGR